MLVKIEYTICFSMTADLLLVFSLCLTCKQIRAVATPALYQLLLINYDAWEHRSGYFSYYNPGHQHVRRIRLCGLPSSADASVNTKTNATLRAILYLLPPNRLREITATKLTVLEPETLLMMTVGQQRLEDIFAGPLRSADLPRALDVGGYFKFLNHLDTPAQITYGTDLDVHGQLLRTCPGLKVVTITRCSVLETKDPALELLKDDAQKLTQFTMDKLFGGACVSLPSQLQVLSLVEIDMSIAASILSRSMDMSRLRTLELDDCPSTGILLDALAKLSKQSASGSEGQLLLKALSVSTWSEVCECTSLEAFLASFSGLEWLEIRLDLYDGDFHPKSLFGHASTLTHLRISLGVDEERVTQQVFEQQELSMLLQKCTALEELALALPDVNLKDFVPRASTSMFAQTLVSSLNP